MKITNKGLYWGLIVTFGLLYVLVAFVSTLHAIDFFKLANVTSLAVLLGIAYEVGQATVLFSILMTKNKEKFLPWVLMILLTALQVTANVYASFKHMSLSGNEDWQYWYTSILKIFGVQGGNAESYQVIISWISGALLPIVALGMTALVAQNIKLITEDDTENVIEDEKEELPEPGVDKMVFTPVGEESRIKSVEELVKEDVPSHEVQDEVSKIKEIIKKEEQIGGTIPDEIKKAISPGIEKEDENTPVIPEGKIETPLQPQTIIDEELPPVIDYEINKEEGVIIEPPMSVEEIKKLRQPTQEEPVLNPEGLKDYIDNVLTHRTEVEEEVKDETPLLDKIKTELEVEPPKPVVEPEPEIEPTPPVEYAGEKPSEDVEETEEDRQERLRNIAREKLKKK